MEKLGLPISAQIRVATSVAIRHKVVAAVEKIPEITECYRGTGSDCFFIKTSARSISHLEEIIDKLTHLGQLTTSVFLSPVLERRIMIDEVLK
jgi:Lrp/AsnC family leucine-responsive transcriptional regulator